MKHLFRLVCAAAATVSLTAAHGCGAGQSSSRSPSHPGFASNEKLVPEIDRYRIELERRTGNRHALRDGDPLLWAARALDAIDRQFVDPVDAAELVDVAIDAIPPAEGTRDESAADIVDASIEAMVNHIDRDGDYLVRDDTSEPREGAGNERGGTGLELDLLDGVATVMSTVEGGPAGRSGLAAGDAILAVDNLPVAGLPLQQLVQRLRGPVGSEVAVTVMRRSGQTTTISLVRERITIAGATIQHRSGACATIRIKLFHARTTEEVRSALRELASNRGLRGLVLDLRGNTGGLLPSAIGVADLFVESGLLAKLVGRGDTAGERFFATATDERSAAPLLAIVVNEETAAGAEVLTLALKAHRQARVVGRRTFGRGTVQTMIPVSDTRTLKLTTSRILDPHGSTFEKGIEPDVAIEFEIDSVPKNTADSVIRRAYDVLGCNGATSS